MADLEHVILDSSSSAVIRLQQSLDLQARDNYFNDPRRALRFSVLHKVYISLPNGYTW